MQEYRNCNREALTTPKRYRSVLFLLVLVLLLTAACKPQEGAEKAEPFDLRRPKTVSYMGQPMPDLAALAEQKDLDRIDLRGHAMHPEEIETLQQALPKCEILYSIAIGGSTYACTAESLKIENISAEELSLLEYFPVLKELDVRGCKLGSEIEAYAAKHPDIKVLWSIPIGEIDVDHETQWLDLSMAELPETDELIEQLRRLPNLTDVSLVGCDLSRADQILLLKELPHLRLYWMVDVNGKLFKNTETHLDFTTVNFNGAEDLAEIVACFQDPQWVDVATHGFESVEMSELCERFPNTEFVWTVRIGKFSIRTDIEVFYGRSSGGDRLLRDGDLEPLKYCKNLRAVNISRQSLSDLSPLAELEQLEVLIISNNKISDLSPLEGLQNLKYLEAHNNYIKDLTPHTALQELRDINVMFNDIEDFSPLLKCGKLDRAYLSRNEGLENGVWQSELTAGLPKTQIDFDDSNARGWQNHDRYDILDRIWTSTHMEPLY